MAAALPADFARPAVLARCADITSYGLSTGQFDVSVTAPRNQRRLTQDFFRDPAARSLVMFPHFVICFDVSGLSFSNRGFH
jgi:hypothetical protein